MLRALLTAFRIREIRNKILFTIGILAIYRLGANITIPGVDAGVILAQVETGVLGMMDLFSGGALGNFAVFSLGIMPYITATIIMQLLQAVIPFFDVNHDLLATLFVVVGNVRIKAGNWIEAVVNIDPAGTANF